MHAYLSAGESIDIPDTHRAGTKIKIQDASSDKPQIIHGKIVISKLYVNVRLQWKLKAQ